MGALKNDQLAIEVALHEGQLDCAASVCDCDSKIAMWTFTLKRNGVFVERKSGGGGVHAIHARGERLLSR